MVPGTAHYFLLAISLEFILAVKSDGQVLEYRTDVRLEKGKLVTEYRYIIQINSKELDWLSNVSIPYNEGDKVEILEASIVGVDGKELRSLGKKEITARHNISEGSFFEDDWVLEFSLKWNQYPYRIAYHYRTIEERYLYLCRWLPVPYLYNVSVEKASLNVSHPRDFRVLIDHPKDQKGDSTLVKDQVVRTWHYENLAAGKREKYSPHASDLLPQIIVAPKSFVYGIPGSMDSWASYGKWQATLNVGTTDLPLYELQKIEKITKETSNKNEIIRRLYHYVQDNTRYINVAIDVGGLKSYPASYVSKNRYGDCKALTTFTKCLLKAAGIESYYAYLNGAEVPRAIRKEIPGPQFNHVVLCIPMGIDTIWLENTANFLPYNYLGTFTQDRDALLTTDTDSRIVRTPSLKPAQVKTIKSYEIEIDKEGVGKATANWLLRGDEFETIRSYQVNETEDNLRTVIEKGIAWSGCRLSKWTIRQESRDTPEIELALELDLTKQIRKLGNTLVIKPFQLSLPDWEDPPKRKNPVSLPYPTDIEQSMSYRLDFIREFKVSLPQDVHHETAFGSYLVTYYIENDVIRVVRKLVVSKGNIPLSNYEKFYSFFKGIQDFDRQSAIILEPNPNGTR